MNKIVEALPIAWLCEFLQEDGTTIRAFVEQDPAGLRWNDEGEPSPFKVTPLYIRAQPAAQEERTERGRFEAWYAQQPKRGVGAMSRGPVWAAWQAAQQERKP